MRTNQASRNLIQEFESLRLIAYQDDRGVWTIGWGHTRGVKPGQEISRVKAEDFFEADLKEAESQVRWYVNGPLTENEFSALVSFAFNLGPKGFRDPVTKEPTTILKKLNAGDKIGAAEQFHRWVYDNHKKVGGLERRRAAERELFLTP